MTPWIGNFWKKTRKRGVPSKTRGKRKAYIGLKGWPRGKRGPCPAAKAGEAGEDALWRAKRGQDSRTQARQTSGPAKDPPSPAVLLPEELSEAQGSVETSGLRINLAGGCETGRPLPFPWSD